VGTKNRERRAAKKRARERRGTRTPGNDTFEPGFVQTPPVTELVAIAVWEAAHDCAEGGTDAAALCAKGLNNHPPRSVDIGVDMALHRAVGYLWAHGWLPYDVVRFVGKQLGELATALITDVIAADAAQYAKTTVHERWLEQLQQIEATIWWDQGHPHLSQWTQRHGCDRTEALALSITVLAAAMTMPKLPMILPPPGTAKIVDAAAHHGVDQKVLTRVRGLLAKAESTQFPEEAEALSAKAQELMNRHALERAMLDAEEHTPQTATSRRMWLDNPYVGAKAQLVHIVASANRCRAVNYEKLGFVALLGDEMDLEITELLATSLLLQATRALVAAGSQISRDGQSRTRSYRQSFLLAYATRIGERLRTVTVVSEADDRLLPVLVDRQKAVDELFEAMFPATVTKSYSASNAAGWGAGRAAADRADLGLDRTELH
jgi:Protein of unknown function (DUF2786)